MDLQSIKSNAWGLVADRRFFLVLGITVIFIIAALYVWKTYISGRLNQSYVPNKEFVNKGGGDSPEADLYFFYTVWCPHCKKARPQWDKFKEIIGETKIKGVHINFLEVDCDKDTATADRFKVDGYPTIKLIHNDRVIEYDAKPEVETLRQFLNVSL